MIPNTFFRDAFAELSDEAQEQYHKTVFMHMQGAAAEKVRIEYYKPLFRDMGDNVTIGSGVKIVNPQNISLGNNVVISDNCTLYARSPKGITLGDSTTLKPGVYLDTETEDEGYIDIGERVYVGTGCCLQGHMGLEIGDDTLLAQNITITPFSHNFSDPKELIIKQGGNSRKVTIGRDCYIGMNCCILYSADVLEGSVVGSGSVVVHTIPSYSLAVGVPAKVIKKRGS